MSIRVVITDDVHRSMDGSMSNRSRESINNLLKRIGHRDVDLYFVNGDKLRVSYIEGADEGLSDSYGLHVHPKGAQYDGKANYHVERLFVPMKNITKIVTR